MDQSDTEKDENSRKEVSSRTRVMFTEPDKTLSRYMIEEFKAKAASSKPVPFEKMDLDLYSPKALLVGFQTSEDRLKLWIKAIILRYVDYLAEQQGLDITWEETENYSFPDRPDKIKVSVKKNEAKLFVISVFVTTGRIQVQGSSYIHWATHEFPLLLKVIDKLTTSEDSLVESQKDFFDFNQDEDQDEDIESQTSSESSEEENEDDKEDDDRYSEIEYPVDSVLVQTLTDTLSNLERNFIKSKDDFENDIQAIRTSLQEVLNVKDRLVVLENKLKAQIANFDDKHHHNETEINNANKKINELSSQLKKQQEQKTQLVAKQAHLTDQITDLKTENSDLKREIFILRELAQKHENAIHSNEDQARFTNTPNQNSNDTAPETDPEQEVDLLLLTDSNGKFIKTDLLYPDAKTVHRKSYNLNQTQEILQENIKYRPKQVLIHCGTNDLERKNANQVIDESINILKQIQENLPTTEIIYSSLLVRQDSLQNQVSEVNDAMEQFCKISKIKFIHNNNISNYSLFYDYKHLNRRGFRSFARNLKSAIYGTSTKSINGKRRQQQNQMDHSSFMHQPYIQPSSNKQPNRQLSYADVLAAGPKLNHRHQSHPTTGQSYAVHSPFHSHQQHMAVPGTFANQQTEIDKSLSNQAGLPFSLKSLIQQLQSFL